MIFKSKFKGEYFIDIIGTLAVLISITVLPNKSYSQQDSSNSLFHRWDITDKLIRDRKIDKNDALDSIDYYVSQAVKLKIETTKRKDWVFPMKGWTKITYRENGKDYRARTFDYFQGGESKGHPAHDIFILDADSNSSEDSTGLKVDAVAMVNGIIISIHDSWKPEDLLRSGNYVKLFDPETQAIFYYSHLDSIFVSVGQIVQAGDRLAYIGRTGRKAIRGKTHLHIAYYKIIDGYPKPEDIIQNLYDSQKQY